jgi:hypothetical protein
MMIPTLLDEVMKLNNESVLRLREGNDQMALGLLSKCVALVRTNLVCSGRQEKQLIFSSSRMGTAGYVNSVPSQQSRTWSGENYCPSNYVPQEPKNGKAHQLEKCRDKNIIHKESFQLQPLNNREGKGCYIYNHMLLFAPQEDETDTLLPAHRTAALSSNECTTVVRAQSSVVLFNLALIYHLRGRLGHFHSLTTAFRLYKMASQLLTDNCVLTNETAAVVKLGTVNNMFQIRYEQGNLGSALNILQFLSSLMRGLYPNPDIIISLDRHDYRGFMKNILLLRPPEFAPAA